MIATKAAEDDSDDLRIIRACVEHQSQVLWAEFFERFEDRFRGWIAATLRDSNEQDREDAYQAVVERILRGKVLPRIDLGASSKSEAYLFKTVQNLARKSHHHKARLAEEPLDDGNPVSSHLARLADKASPIQGSVVFNRLVEGLVASGISREKLDVFDGLIDCKNISQVIRTTRLKRPTVYRYVRELDKLAHEVLGVPYKKAKKKGLE